MFQRNLAQWPECGRNVTYQRCSLLQDDSEAMAAAVRRVLTEPGLAERLSRNARKKAEGFDWSLIQEQWHQLLKSIIVLQGM